MKKLLIDPMCGSGTILIEAAMIGINKAPGLQRSFVSEKWDIIDQNLWQLTKEQAVKDQKLNHRLNIKGFDLDPQRIDDARGNAKRAGVEEYIELKQKDIIDLEISDEYGIMITNPPYGIKLGASNALKSLYKSLESHFHSKSGWSYIFIQRMKISKKF